MEILETPTGPLANAPTILSAARPSPIGTHLPRHLAIGLLILQKLRSAADDRLSVLSRSTSTGLPKVGDEGIVDNDEQFDCTP